MPLPRLSAVILLVTLGAGLALCAASTPAPPLPAPDRNSPAAQAFSAIPGWFEPQSPGVFISHGHAPAVALQQRGILFSLPTEAGQSLRTLPVSLPGAHRLRWAGDEKLPGITSYFIGSDRSRWRPGVPHYARVRAASVWPGVDLVVYNQARRMEYDFVLAPGADVRRVRLQFGSGWRVSVDASGDLNVTDGDVTFRQQKPVAWQSRGDRRIEVASSFRLLRDGSVGFHVSDYDPSRELVIDPVLGFSSLIGGDTEDLIYGVVAVSDGYWLTGATGSTFTVPSTITPFKGTRSGFLDIFLAKITIGSTGAPTLAYYTYIGGSDNDVPAGIVAAPDGTLAIVGSTYSKDFPATTTTAFQGTYGGLWEAFVLKFDPSQAAANQVVYASYFGTGAQDYGTAVALRPNGHIIAVGTSLSTSLPQTPANAGITATSAGQQDNFVLEVDPTASTPAASLVYATFLGGGLTDIPNAVALDQQGRIYLAGTSASGNYPAAGTPYQTYLTSRQNAFLSVIDTTQAPASQLVYSTYFGGEGLDVPTGMALDAQGQVWMTGYTTSTRFPVTSNAVQPVFSGQVSAWLARVDITKTGSAFFTYSTFFNGSHSTIPLALQLDSLGRPTIGGYTDSPDLPVVAPLSIQSPLQLMSAFLATVDPTKSGSAGLVFSTFFGGSTLNTVTSLDLDSSGSLIVGGYTSSADFPVTDGSTRNSPAGADTGFYMLLLDPNPYYNRGTTIPARPGHRRTAPHEIDPPSVRPAPAGASSKASYQSY